MRGEGIIIEPRYIREEKFIDKTKFRQEIEKKTKAFLEKGGEIEKIGIGVSAKFKKKKFNNRDRVEE